MIGVSGLVFTGSLTGLLKGAVSGALFAGIGNAFRTGGSAARVFGNVARGAKVVAHGIVGGIMSDWNGGSFSKGFLSAGVTQAFAKTIGGLKAATRFGGTLLRATAASLVGGLTSKLAGGSFSMGARIGFFSRMFNDELNHGISQKQDYKPTRVSSGDSWWEPTDNFRTGPDATTSGVEITPWTEKFRGWFGFEAGPSVNVRSGAITLEQQLWIEMEPTKNVMMDGYGNIDPGSPALWMPARLTGTEVWRYTGNVLDINVSPPIPCFSYGTSSLCLQ